MTTVSDAIVMLDPTTVDIGWRARQEMGEIDKLAASIDSEGQIHPIAVSKVGAAHQLIAGHRRLLACKHLGRKVRAVVVDTAHEEDSLRIQLVENLQRKSFTRLELGEGLVRWRDAYAQQHKLRPAHRPKVSEEGTFDTRFTTFASEILGCSEGLVYEALMLVKSLSEDEKDSISSIPDPRKRSKAEQAAMSKIRRARRVEKLKVRARERANADETVSHLHLGDNAPILSKLDKQGWRFDLCATDPPYSLHWSPIDHAERTSLNEEPTWDNLDVGWLWRVDRVMASDATIVAFCPAEAIGVYREALEELGNGWKYRGAIVWRKTNPTPQHRSGYAQATEFAIWATRGVSYFRPWDNAGLAEAHNVIEGGVCQGDERLQHPTQKPLWLMEKIIARHADEGHYVLDPFAGTGTTAVAAKKRGLLSVSCEADASYFELAKIRLAAL